MAQISSIERRILSGSTNGKGILITGTDVNGANTIHTATSTSGEIDEVWLYCYNSGTATITLTLCLGGTTDPDDLSKVNIPAQSGEILCLHGECFNGGVVIKAFADTTNKLIIRGYVNRMTITT